MQTPLMNAIEETLKLATEAIMPLPATETDDECPTAQEEAAREARLDSLLKDHHHADYRAQAIRDNAEGFCELHDKYKHKPAEFMTRFEALLREHLEEYL